MNSRYVKRLQFAVVVLALWQIATPKAAAQQTVGATFGDIIRLPGGTPSDIVLDELRHQLYLVNNTTSQVLVYDYNTNTVSATISVGKTPLAAAMSMDNNWLYVTCSGNTSLNVIDLSSNRVVNSILLPSAPQGVETGNDGRVLIAMNGTGVVNGVPQGTLAIYDSTLTSGQQVLPVTVPALPATPPPLPPPNTNGRPQTTFLSKLMRTPDGQFIVGVIAPSNAATYVFVYEVASGIVLRNRTISGQSTVLSMAPDGSKFMAGYSLFDTATLSVIAQENNANAPFPFASAFNTVQNVGGSAFSPDGTTLYAAFNTSPATTPAPPPTASTLLVNDPANLGIRLGIKLPESIIAKMVMRSNGADAWGLSDSGILHLPVGNLYNYPILAPQTTDVFLAMDDCNHGIASGALAINNLGKGKLSYSVAPTTNSTALVYQQSSGLAPSNVTFTMEPGRSGVARQAGTNIWTGAGTIQGTRYNVTMTSAEAINQPNTISVYMNYRNSDQRGLVFPVPTTPNSSSTGTTNANGNEGLQDILLDEPRGRLYITNSGYNRIEVFDTKQMKFLNPIPVGQLPHQMALGTDGTTLYVGNTGGESISIVDLNLQQVVGNVVFPPYPRNGTTAIIYPRTLAMGLFGLQFIMSNGTQWQVVGNNALPRPASSVIPTTLATSNGPSYGMISTPGYDHILTMSGNGNAYVYDSTSDQYVASRLIFPTIQGYYGVLGALAGGNYLLADTLIMNPSLGTVGGAATPSAAGPITPSRNVAAVAPLDANNYLRLTTSIRASITASTSDDSRTTLELVNIANGSDSLVGVAPEEPVFSVFGTTRFNANPRMMVVDSGGKTAYAITFSGLSVIPLAPATAASRPVINPGTSGIVNAADGTPSIQPGSFITISGQNLASPATASTTPPPTVLGGSCVTFGDISVPLLQTSSGKIQAQVPDTLLPGTQVVEVRSLAMAQDSDPVTITVRPSSSASKPTFEVPTPAIRKRGGQ